MSIGWRRQLDDHRDDQARPAENRTTLRAGQDSRLSLGELVADGPWTRQVPPVGLVSGIVRQRFLAYRRTSVPLPKARTDSKVKSVM